MEIYQILKKLRVMSGFKQEDIAKIISKKRANYSQKENGKTVFSANELLLLLDFFRNHVTGDEYSNALKNLFEYDISPQNVSNITKEHQRLVEQFQDQEAGKEANEGLIRLEKLDPDVFRGIIYQIQKKVKELEKTKKLKDKDSLPDEKKTGTFSP
ncbi:MAG: helix-turn-helix transcriptional regulator [Desulfobacterales bacterium]|nr:helix-turn-helix transcriptional regulator [Desulfobacterales bacterium]